MKPAASPRSRQYSQLRPPSEDSPLTAYSPLHAARSYTRGVQKTASTRWKWAVGKIEDQYEHYVKAHSLVLGVGLGDFHHHEVILEHLLVVCDEALG